MKRIFSVFILVVVCFLLVARIEEPKRIRAYVTHIDIYANHPENSAHYRLTDDKEMGVILNHLRAMNRRPPAEESPVPDPHNNYTIWVYLADGRCHLYEQLGTRFFRKDTRQWKALNPDLAKNLILYEGQFHTAFYFSESTPKIFDKTANVIPLAFV